MDRAWCRNLKKYVTDYELYLDPDKQNDYECCGCDVTVIPCATVKGQYKKKPYFKLLPNTTHKSSCDCYGNGSTSIKSRLAKGDITSLPVPQVFTLRKDPVKTDTSVHESAISQSTTVSTRVNDPISTSRERKHTTSFQSVADAYAINPKDMNKVSLRFEGVEGNTYGEIFRTIYNINPAYGNEYGNKPKVFWVRMSWISPTQEENTIIVSLNRGLWQDKKLKPYYLRIDTIDWEPTQINRFLFRYQTTREVIKADEKRKGYIAFVGTQDQDDYFIFHANKLVATTLRDE